MMSIDKGRRQIVPTFRGVEVFVTWKLCIWREEEKGGSYCEFLETGFMVWC